MNPDVPARMRVVAALAGLLCLGPNIVHAACQSQVGRFVSIGGSVEVQSQDEEAWAVASLETGLCEGDSIRVGDRSRATVALINESVLSIDESTTIRLLDIKSEKGERSWLEAVKGTFQSFSRKPRYLTVNTPYLNGSIEGTEFVVRVEDKSSEITVFEGVVRASNKQGEVAVSPGESARAAAGQAPVRRIVVRPRDQVQWSLYYPPILSGSALASKSPALAEAVSCADRGDTVCAFAALDRVPANAQDAQFYLLRASLLLSVGRVEEAKADIDASLETDPNAGLAYSLRSVIAVAQNDNAAALKDARRGVELDPTSASAKIALSYALQANLQIEEARDTLLRAVDDNPEDALAWARLSELWLMLGERKQSREAAQRAAALQPSLARTQYVLGFAALSEIRLREARAAFERAIALDSADPLPHLGLGLAKIRGGQLVPGTRDIEAAVALDGNSALLRAYLGKAYFEEKRAPLDAQQFAIAQQLDPKDPTAYFYDAIQKQTTNRPVEALQEMQTAIELNDNRAVYRSRLLLDSDRAARGASLANIYNDLGFQQLGLVEGWKAVNTDPSNSAGHRFLADTYAILPRHEIARVSELLQSQLLDPLNATPIQPLLGESNLFLISSLGPATVGFNEFNELFTRNGFTFQVSGLIGGDSTSAGQAIVSGIHDKTSFSLGGFHYQTDGFRDNADQKDTIANVFIQQELSPSTSIQAEYRYRETEYGDLRQKFFPESVFPAQRFKAQSDTWRLGARQSLSPASTILGSVTYQEGSFRETHDPFPQPGVLYFDLNQPNQSAAGGELQYLLRGSAFNLTAGAGYFDVNDNVEQLVRFGYPFIPGPPITPPTIEVPGSTPLDLSQANVYAYSNVSPVENLTLSLGVSYDDADSEYLDEVKEQFNPKLGITWSPWTQTTFRAAAFKVLNRTLITQQTLEPTQVAGFNQFFDEFDLTEYWRYGLAIDQKFTSTVFGGLEASKRDLKVPFLNFQTDPQSPPTEEASWNEDLARAYLYWTPTGRVALRAEYMFERLDRKEPFVQGVVDSDTQRVPLGVSYFDPSGLSASMTATYYNQEGKFGGFWATDPIQKGNSSFWTVDLGVSYRLPKRYGFVTVAATNLFDEEFQFYDSDLNNASIQPGRMLFGSVTVALP